jgi:hypothetical protein
MFDELDLKIDDTTASAAQAALTPACPFITRIPCKAA